MYNEEFNLRVRVHNREDAIAALKHAIKQLKRDEHVVDCLTRDYHYQYHFTPVHFPDYSWCLL